MIIEMKVVQQKKIRKMLYDWMLFHEKNLEKKIASFKRKMHFVNKEYNEK